MLEIKILVSQTKCSMERVKSDRVSEYEDKVEELVLSTQVDNKYFKTYELEMKDIWDTLKWPNQQILDTESSMQKA